MVIIMKSRLLCYTLIFAIVALAAAAPVHAESASHKVTFDDGRFLTLDFSDLIAVETIMVRGEGGVTEEQVFMIPYTGTVVVFGGWVEGEGCWNENLIYRDGAYEPNGSTWRTWDIFPDYSVGLILDFDSEYGGDYDYYEQNDFVDCYHGVYFKYSNDYRPAWHDKISPWALDEVVGAIAAGLVPDTIAEKDYYIGSITRVETAQLLVSLIETTTGWPIDEYMSIMGVTADDGVFSDTGDAAVLAANALGIINGVGGGKFDPGGILTRAQIAAIINRTARLLGEDTTGFSHTFTDVKGHWVDSELGWPLSKNIMLGVGDNKFDPEGLLTTEQAVMVMYRSYMAFTRQ